MSRETILVVEDETSIQELLKYNLEKEGFRVLLADTGEKGLAAAAQKRPDLILLDLMLPRIDGMEVCRHLKRERSTREIPVVIISARNTEVDQVVGLEIGAVDYLTKPFSVKVLLARVKNALRSHATPPSQSVLRSGEFLLDRRAARFSIQGKTVALTKTELGILTLLMEKPDVVLSRDQLVATVWGPGSLVSPASVNMQIKGLRDKLGKFGGAIETVRGLGYRFINA